MARESLPEQERVAHQRPRQHHQCTEEERPRSERSGDSRTGSPGPEPKGDANAELKMEPQVSTCGTTEGFIPGPGGDEYDAPPPPLPPWKLTRDKTFNWFDDAPYPGLQDLRSPFPDDPAVPVPNANANVGPGWWQASGTAPAPAPGPAPPGMMMWAPGPTGMVMLPPQPLVAGPLGGASPADSQQVQPPPPVPAPPQHNIGAAGASAWQPSMSPGPMTTESQALQTGPSELCVSPAGATEPKSLAGPSEAASRRAPLQPQTLVCEPGLDGRIRFIWTVDARKLRGNDRGAVSPQFQLKDKAGRPCEFKLMINPLVSSTKKGGSCFRSSKGQGIVQLKSESADSAMLDGTLDFYISIGSGPTTADKEKRQAPRGPVRMLLSQGGVCGLPKDHEVWDFTQVVNEASQTFDVTLELLMGQ